MRLEEKRKLQGVSANENFSLSIFISVGMSALEKMNQRDPIVRSQSSNLLHRHCIPSLQHHCNCQQHGRPNGVIICSSPQVLGTFSTASLQLLVAQYVRQKFIQFILLSYSYTSPVTTCDAQQEKSLKTFTNREKETPKLEVYSDENYTK